MKCMNLLSPFASWLLMCCCAITISCVVISCGVESSESRTSGYSDASLGAFTVSYDRGAEVGTIPLGATAVRTMTISNNSDAQIRFQLDRVSCSCITVSQNSGVIDPQESAQVEIVASVSVPGPSQRHGAKFIVTPVADYREGDSRRAEFIAEIAFVPHSEFEVHPLFLDISVVAGQTFQRNITLYRSGDAGFPSVDSASCSVEGIDCLIDDSGGGNPRIVSILISGSLRYEHNGQNGVILLETNDPQYPKIEIPLTVSVQPGVTVRPGGIAWTSESADSSRTFLLDLIGVVPTDLPLSTRLIGMSADETVGLRVNVLDREGPLSVEVDRAQLPPTGSCMIEIRSQRGQLLAKIPVSWITLPKTQDLQTQD